MNHLIWNRVNLGQPVYPVIEGSQLVHCSWLTSSAGVYWETPGLIGSKVNCSWLNTGIFKFIPQELILGLKEIKQVWWICVSCWLPVESLAYSQLLLRQLEKSQATQPPAVTFFLAVFLEFSKFSLVHDSVLSFSVERQLPETEAPCVNTPKCTSVASTRDLLVSSLVVC